MTEIRPLPSREELVAQLTKLNEVTLEVNELMGELGSAKTKDEMEILRQSINQKTQQQSEIIELFLVFSTDKEQVRQFKEIVQDITKDAQLLETLTSEQEIILLQDKVNAKMTKWSNLLETIIAGVMSQTK